MERFYTSLVHFFVNSLQPIDLIESPRLIELVRYMEPQLVLPSEGILTHQIIRHFYKKTKEELLNELADAEFVALSTELWIWKDTVRFLTVRVHFVDADMNRKSRVLNTQTAHDYYNTDDFHTVLVKIAQEWNIVQKIHCVVSKHNYKPLIEAVGRTNWTHVPCFGDSLKCLVSTALKRHTNKLHVICKKCRDIMKYFLDSDDRLATLQELSGGDEIPEFRLDFPDREWQWANDWVCTLSIVRKVTQLRPSVVVALQLFGVEDSLNLEPDEWTLAEGFCQLLGPYENLARELSSELYVVISKVSYIINMVSCIVCWSSLLFRF